LSRWKGGASAPRNELFQERSSEGRGNAWRIALILLCAVATALPYLWRGPTCGHDFDFHLQSWLAAAQQWRHGVFYPNWIEGANFGAGEPRFVFYPPISWMLGALAGSLFPWNIAPAVFTLVVMAGYGLSMYSLARDWMPPNTATLAACAYILSPYALFVAYERTAYGELAAGIWLPLIVRFALRLTGSSYAGRNSAGPDSANSPFHLHRDAIISVLGLSLAIAAVWLSNAPAAVMSCYFLAAIVLWRSIGLRRLRPALPATAGLLLGLGLAAFYIVPAAYERRWVDITHALSPGVRYQDGFLFSHSGDVFHDAVLRKISWIFVTILATICFCVLVAWLRGRSRRILLPLLATSAVLLALQMPWSAPIWEHTPELKFLQFPWRWTLVLSLVFAATIGLAATPREPSDRRSFTRSLPFHAAILLLAVLAIIPKAAKLFWQYCDDEDAVSAQVELFQSGSGYEGTDEYAPLGADNSLVQQALPRIRLLKSPDAETAPSPAGDDQANPAYSPDPNDELPAQIDIQLWEPEHRSATITLPTAGFAVLRLMDYPALQVRANGAVQTSRPHRADGLMAIPIQPGTTHIEIRYASTPDTWWGRGLSAISLLAMLALLAAARK
jgi:hypothetical protein